ncbi:helix-turn-helix domain-containing protein [Puniceicoccaceae bacterium K14]|nr:helix-turn-helix domain-containing protein [Puniceicoccaceae bacterium K14]
MTKIIGTMDVYGKSDKALQREIGERLQMARLNANMSQQELADTSGVSRNTIVNAESGQSCTLGTLIALLRGLKMLDQLDLLLPPQTISPIQLFKLQGKQRRRATGKRQTKEVAEDPGPWNWKE